MSTIVTFYSYKGGVGRTSALANIAVLLARRGQRVLMIDFDLEAPGLDQYFADFLPEPPVEGIGLIYLLHSAFTSPDASWKSHLRQVSLPSEGDPTWPNALLDIIPSGSSGQDYSELVAGFSWKSFFEDRAGGPVLEQWREEWKNLYDFVLIDSRTGITDAGGVCTILLPDVLALVFVSSNQSFDGALAVAQAAKAAREGLGVPRPPLAVLPILSRFDRRDEVAEADRWLVRFSTLLKPFYDDWLPKNFGPLQIIERTKIPYVTRFSFGEQLPVLTHGVSDPEMPGFYFRNLSRLLETDFADAAAIIDPELAKESQIIYVSYCGEDEGFSRSLGRSLAERASSVRFELGDACCAGIGRLRAKAALDEASGYVVVVTPSALSSSLVAAELSYALRVLRAKGPSGFQILLLRVDGAGLGPLAEIFETPPLSIDVANDPALIDNAVPRILAALDILARPGSELARPLEELVLELSDPGFLGGELGVVRLQARAIHTNGRMSRSNHLLTTP